MLEGIVEGGCNTPVYSLYLYEVFVSHMCLGYRSISLCSFSNCVSEPNFVSLGESFCVCPAYYVTPSTKQDHQRVMVDPMLLIV